MNGFIVVCVIIGGIFLYFNRNYLKSLWDEHFCGDFNSNEPSFCFECNQNNDDICNACEARKLWEKGDKNKARDVFFSDYR